MQADSGKPDALLVESQPMGANQRKVEDRIPYVILFVENLERSVEFYRDFLGLQERAFPVASRMGGVALAIQGTTIVLLDKSKAQGRLPMEIANPPAPGNCYPSFIVPDLAAFHAVAVTNGVNCAQTPQGDEFGRFAVYEDPDGLLFSVVQPVQASQRHAVVLSGGGAFGAFELGVLSQLADDRTQPDPDIFTGTSVGGFNAAVLTCRYPEYKTFRHAVDDLIGIWRSQVAGGLQDNGVFRMRGDLLRALDPDAMVRASPKPLFEMMSDAAYLTLDASKRLANLALSSEPVSRRVIELVDISTFLSTEPLQQLVSRNVSYSDIYSSPRVLKLAATDWLTGKLRLFVHYPKNHKPERLGSNEVEISEEDVHEAVLASAAIPGVFPPVAIPSPKGTPFVDGGVVMNTPLNPAIDAGADVIHLICLNPDVEALALGAISNTFDVFQRMLVAAVAGHVSSDLDRARLINSIAGVARRPRTGQLYRPVTIHRYHPPPDHLGGVVGMLDFSSEHIEALIRDGLETAKNHDCEIAKCVVAKELAN